MRSGDDYLASLKDGRAVYLDGERVKDVTRHPAFERPIRQIAMMYDRAREASALAQTTVVDPQRGIRTPTMWLIPRSAEELGVRRRGHRFWAEGSYGHMGRTPDCVASVITAFASAPEVFARGGPQFATNVTRFYQEARERDLYLTYAVNPPHVDRSKPAHQQPEPYLYAGVARERDDGIVLRGALMIATAAVLADEVLVTYLVPLQPGDEAYAFSAVVPCGADGVRLYPRRPYGSTATEVTDYPLSARFDETDSLLVLDDVFVPWERVFVYRNVELIHAQWYDTPAHLLSNFQALVRFTVKFEFAAGLAIKLVELHNTVGSPSVQMELGGEFVTPCAAIESLLWSAESRAILRGGVAWPNPESLYAAQSLQQRTVADLIKVLRKLGGGAFLSVPSSHRAFESSETAADARRYYRSVNMGAEERIKLLSLIWDFIGTEFGGRQLQYEMFYSAGQHVVDTRAFRFFDWERGRRLVDRCLDEYERGDAP